MCCCGKPTINGEQGYRWNVPDGPTSIRPVDPPALADGDVLLVDEPGRCGGLDSHHLHLRVVAKNATSRAAELLVRHGCGDERIRLSGPVASYLPSLDSNGRYWMLSAIYQAHSDGARDARQKESLRWRKAANDKRIKTRKLRGTNQYKVWIEPEAITPRAVTAHDPDWKVTDMRRED
jgi:hypothetical protein